LFSKLATPGRIDLLPIKKWFRGELQPVGPLTRNGQTEFQTYGDDGGLDFSVIEYIWGGFQVCLEQPKYGLYFDGCNIPAERKADGRRAAQIARRRISARL
jgi:hypothetical protein